MADSDPDELTMDRLRRALAGDRTAMRAVVDTLTPIIQARVARTLVRRKWHTSGRDVRQEVGDLTQQVFVALLSDGARALRAWDPARGASLAGFVGLLAEREVVSVLRTQSRNPWSEVPTESDDLERGHEPLAHPEASAASREVLVEIWKRLQARLTGRGIEMFEWLYVDGRSVEEVCVLTGMSVDAVHAWRSRLGRAAREVAAEVMSDSSPATRTSEVRTP